MRVDPHQTAMYCARKQHGCTVRLRCSHLRARWLHGHLRRYRDDSCCVYYPLKRDNRWSPHRRGDDIELFIKTAMHIASQLKKMYLCVIK